MLASVNREGVTLEQKKTTLKIKNGFFCFLSRGNCLLSKTKSFDDSTISCDIFVHQVV